jgi:uncharacterized protein (TIGR02271 family)
MMTTHGDEAVRRIGELSGPTEGLLDSRGWQVSTSDGTAAGTVEDLLVSPAAMEVRYFLVSVVPELAPDASMRTLRVPAAHARVDAERRHVHLNTLSSADLGLLPVDRAVAPGQPPVGGRGGEDEEIRLVLSHEELDVRTRSVAKGEVRVEKRVETKQVREVVPVTREDVSIERRPVPEGITDFAPRVEGDVTYVPLVVEELVIQKRLVAREELVIRKTKVTEEQVVEESLRWEVPVVHRPDGTVDDGSSSRPADGERGARSRD